jgi:ParB family chromosome partitioning protein
MAKHPLIALDLLVYQAAVSLFDNRRTHDGADVQFKTAGVKRWSNGETPVANGAFVSVAKSLPLDWLKVDGEAERFESFRLLPESSKLDILAYCVASTLKPKLGSPAGEDVTAYDVALSLTAAGVADYWRPTKDNFLSRLTREQLLAIGREVLGDLWAQSNYTVKKALLVDQLNRAFADPEMPGRTPEQIERLKNWLPEGMSFDITATVKPAKAKKARKAA